MSTLAEIRDAIEYDLKDTANALWSADELDEHIRRALRLINRIAPRRLSTTLPSVAAQYEYDLSSIAGLLAVVDVWYPYDAGDPQYPPTRPRWTLIAEDLLLLWDCDPSGDSADAIRIFYTVEHTIAGLDGAGSTTLDAQQEQLIILAATAYAAQQMAQYSIGRVTVSGWTPTQYLRWAQERVSAYRCAIAEYRQQVALQQPSTVPIEGTV